MNKQVRESILNLFRMRECLTLIRPVDEDELLHKLNKLDQQDLREGYINKFNRLREKLFHECPYKTMGGKPINGSILSFLLKQYVQAINKGAVPNIPNAYILKY